MRSQAHSGIVLVLVAGLVVMLMGVAVALVQLTHSRRLATGGAVDRARAGLYAGSGIERAVSETAHGSNPGYGGEDWDDNTTYGGAEETPPHETHEIGILNVADCPVEHARRPSFWSGCDGNLAGTDRAPDWTRVDGRNRGFSGRLRGTYVDRRDTRGDTYTLKVDVARGIFVNGGDLTSAGEHAGTYDTTLRRILGGVAAVLGAPLSRADGEALVTARPAGGWTSWDSLRDTALGGSQAKLDRLRPFLTMEAWVDRKVIAPNVLPSIDGRKFYAWSEIRTGTLDDGSATGMRRFNTRTSSYAPDFERDSAGAIVGRAPVEINWAIRNPAVLRALLTGLEGVYLHEADRESRPYRLWTDPNRYDTVGKMSRVWLTGADVDAIVEALSIHAGFVPSDRYPHWDGTATIDSWEEFTVFVEKGLSGLSPQKRDLLRANFNPNSALNKFNPNQGFFTEVDKSDLLAYSTEFCFRPMGEMRVESLGRVTDQRGALLARRRVQATMLDAAHLRFTTQSEFVAGDGGLGDPEVAGDETSFRAPGDADFLGIYRGPGGTQGFGAKFLGNDGLALQTYPEPQWGPGSPAPAAYDGNIQLATLETDATVEPGLRFLASWGNKMDADFAPGGAAVTRDALHVRPGTMDTSLCGRASGNSLVHTLHPDGLYSEDARAPGYLARDNLNGLRGAVSFWMKPNYHLDRTAPMNGGRGHIFLNLSHLSPGAPAGEAWGFTHVFYLGTLPRDWAAFWETQHVESDTGFEHQLGMLATGYPQPHRWHLDTFFYNFLASTQGEHGALTVDGGQTDSQRNAPYDAYGDGVDPGGGDITTTTSGYEPDGKHRFYLGFRGYETVTMGMGIEVGTGPAVADADATLDEFSFLEMASTDESRTYALSRYRDGRYYKGADGYVEDAVYTSAQVALAPGSVLRGADVTFVLPRYDSVDDPNYVFHKGAKGTQVQVRIVDGEGTEHDSFPVHLGDGRFRYKIEVFPNVEDGNDPLLSSPVLDDVTFHITPPSGVRVVAWEEPIGD